MARRRLEGLERVLGVNALFSTAYGNVGSSIYYALGLVGSVVIAVLVVINVVGVKESAGLNILLAVIDFMTQLLLVLIGAVLVFSPDTLVDNVHLGEAPTWENFILAIPIGMIAYTGIETISNMSEEAKDERHSIPAAINR